MTHGESNGTKQGQYSKSVFEINRVRTAENQDIREPGSQRRKTFHSLEGKCPSLSEAPGMEK